MFSSISAIRVAVLLALICPAAWAADATYKSLRDASLSDSFLVENIVLHRDNGILTLKTGTIAFTPQVVGRDTVAVFIGEGDFTFEPVLPVEKAHLKLVIEQETIHESFDRALFCFSDSAGKEIRSNTKTPKQDPKSADVLKDYRHLLRHSSSEPRSQLEALVTDANMDNLEADLLADLYNPKRPGFFSAYLHGKKHSDLRFFVKPRGVIPTMGPEEVAVMNVDPQADQEGIWYMAHLKDEITSGAASSDEDHRTVSAESYRIETTIEKNDHLTAGAVVKMKAVSDGDRVIKFGLEPVLRVTRVTSGGKAVDFIQETYHTDGTLYVVMPEPTVRGAAQELSIEYQELSSESAVDRIVTKEGGGNFSVGARESWYPAVNSFQDHAVYNLVFKIPKRYILSGVGNLVKEWTEKDVNCSEWNTVVPVPVAGFNYGEFKKAKPIADEPTHTEVDGFAATESPDYLKGAEGQGAMGNLTPSRLLDQGMVTAQMSLRIFNNWFGKSEFTRLAVTQQPAFSYGQSWPTLVYLPISAFFDSTQRWQLMGGNTTRLTEFVDEVIPHEVSHQWWGHMVGWSSYHDQWLSEGFAEFSAGLYLQITEKSPDKYIKYWDHARQYVVEKSAFGRRNTDAGPLWMGSRLNTIKSPHAYDALVYRKGGYILHMLRSMMFDRKDGDKYFREMMQDFVATYMNKNASTEDFQKIVEKHMRPVMDMGDHSMNWFFRQWVYGTAVPKYKFDYTLTPQADGTTLLKATLTQSEVPDDFVVPVPVYVDFDGTPLHIGAVRMVGNTTNDHIQVQLPKKPKRAMINAYHDILEQ